MSACSPPRALRARPERLNRRAGSANLTVVARHGRPVRSAPQPPVPCADDDDMTLEATRDANHLLRLTDEAGVLVLMLDASGRVMKFNQSMENVVGYRLDEVQGEDWFLRFVPLGGQAEMRQACLQTSKAQRAFGYTGSILCRDGSERLIEWFHSDICDDEGLHLGVLCVGRDVTDLKNVRDALRESEERNRGVLETAVSAIITMSERGIIESVNPATERLFGYTRPELIGQNIKLLMPSPYRDQHDGYIDHYKRTGERRIIGIGRETLAQRKDGTIFPVDLSVGEVALASGRIFTGIIRDISDRKVLEQKILEISEEEQQRIGQDIHDDLCQQLAAIGCLAQVVQQKLKQTRGQEAESVAEIVRLISQANARARAMSRGLVPVVLDANGLMAALTELASGTEKVFRLRCHFWCESAVHVADNKAATQLYRIAQEAVGNAVKHSHADCIDIRLNAAEDKLSLTIRDNGRGIPDHRLSGGNGMGLLTMAHRAKMLGGTLTVAPDEAGGTQVECLVPWKNGA
ncbi:MAG: PAS domain-containing sensor histidine kinase [Roseimicrobium sp.]